MGKIAFTARKYLCPASHKLSLYSILIAMLVMSTRDYIDMRMIVDGAG